MVRTARKIIDGQVYEFELVDIWSRPGQWAIQRAYIFLFINFMVYAALNIFIYWMHQARLFDFSWNSYAVTYHKTLIDFLFFPISIHEAPVLIPILGMLMATIIAVPILIAQLYGFRFSVCFAACVLVFAHLPVLCLFLITSSFIAGVSKHKLPFKFGVALISLLPIALYFYVATRGAGMLEYRPVDPTLLYAPWVLAFLAAALIAATVLGFARLVQYRPGGILVGMIPFFAIPGILFHIYIGADQLEFRILNFRFGPASSIFTPVDISSKVFQETLKDWRRYKIRDLRAIVELSMLEFPYIAQQRLQDDRNCILAACEKFQHKYPKSRFVPNSLYIMGLATDMRFDYAVLNKNWAVEYTTDLVSPTSREIWLRLDHEYPETSYAQAARFHLAVLALRDGQTAQAKRLLNQLLNWKQHQPNSPTTKPGELPVSLNELFMAPQQVDTPPIDISGLVEKAQEFLELIENNADDPRFGSEPLAQLFQLDSHHPKYRDHLLELAIKFSGGKLHDNLLVRYALTDPDPLQRRGILERYSKNLAGKDAGAEVLFELGNLLQAMGLANNMDRKILDQAKTYYKNLITAYPKSIFAARARVKLTRLEAMLAEK
jgi:hypothetical protein